MLKVPIAARGPVGRNGTDATSPQSCSIFVCLSVTHILESYVTFFGRSFQILFSIKDRVALRRTANNSRKDKWKQLAASYFCAAF